MAKESTQVLSYASPGNHPGRFRYLNGILPFTGGLLLGGVLAKFVPANVYDFPTSFVLRILLIPFCIAMAMPSPLFANRIRTPKSIGSKASSPTGRRFGVFTTMKLTIGRIKRNIVTVIMALSDVQSYGVPLASMPGADRGKGARQATCDCR